MHTRTWSGWIGKRIVAACGGALLALVITACGADTAASPTVASSALQILLAADSIEITDDLSTMGGDFKKHYSLHRNGDHFIGHAYFSAGYEDTRENIHPI